VSLGAFLEEKKERNRGTQKRKTRRRRKGGICGKQEKSKIAVEQKTGWEMEKILENLEEMRVEINEEIKEMRKEHQEAKREIERLRGEFKNKEKKWEEEKITMSESSTPGKKN
jgi:predicted RNase H-like nuclease (RuvC/YqgF family)